MRSSILFALRCIGSIGLAFAMLLVGLALFDTPHIDAFAAAHVKRVRYPSLTNVARDEDYSRFPINSFGLIGAEPMPLTDTKVRRFAVFGDSFVEAAQVPPEQNFLTLLQGLLAHDPAGRRAEAWNFGFAGDNTGNAYARWQYRPTGVNFDAVIFTFNDGDLLENAIGEAPSNAGAFLVPDPAAGFMLDESRIGKPIGATESRIKRTFGRLFYTVYRIRTRSQEWLAARSTKFSAWLSGLNGAPTENVSAREQPDTARLAAATFAQLRFVHSQISGTGIRCVLVGLPTSRIAVPTDKDADPLRSMAYRQLSKLLHDSGLPFVDTLPLVEAEVARGTDLYGNWEPGGHFNRAGHELVARAIAAQAYELTGMKN